jgi:hypothetical protein
MASARPRSDRGHEFFKAAAIAEPPCNCRQVAQIDQEARAAR